MSIAEETKVRHWADTYTGKRLDLDNPRPEDIDVADIAHALSMQCRYNGACKKFYSVAEHCCLIHDRFLTDFVPALHKHGICSTVPVPAYIRVFALALLMHDAHECYVGDITRAIGSYDWMRDGLNALRARVQDAICRKYAISNSEFDIEDEQAPRRDRLTFSNLMRIYDTGILPTECEQLLEFGASCAPQDIEPLDVVVSRWKPKRAFAEFMFRFLWHIPRTQLTPKVRRRLRKAAKRYGVTEYFRLIQPEGWR